MQECKKANCMSQGNQDSKKTKNIFIEYVQLTNEESKKNAGLQLVRSNKGSDQIARILQLRKQDFKYTKASKEASRKLRKHSSK